MLSAPRPRWPLLTRGADPARGWRGAALAAERTVVRFGACEFRRMDGAHCGTTPVGYPRYACDGLLSEHGLPVRWENVFCMDLETLPVDADGLRVHVHAASVPDAVIVQVGAIYALRHALGEAPYVLNLRDRLAARLPPGAGRAFYSALDLTFPRVGRRFRDYRGAGRLAAFVAAVRATWPGAVVFVELPFVPLREGLWQGAMAARVRRDLRTAAEAAGVEVVDHEGRLGRAAGLRCLNGYNLNAAGSAVVGAFWATRLADLWGPSGRPG